jgi:CubicO group peptidase (beta-lactamase class C family)
MIDARMIFTLIISGIALAAGAQPPVRQASAAEFERALGRELPRWLDEYMVPGAAVALIEHGRVTRLDGYGYADVATRRRVTPDTIFNAGSISKSVTAWGIMRLVDAGRAGLDAPIDSYLERWHLPASAFDARQVTLRRLSSHTAGISEHGYGGSDPAAPPMSVVDSLLGKTGTGEVRLIAEPGSVFRYSGANYRIIELAIEEIAGEDFRAYMQARILAPLRMTHSRFGLPADRAVSMATPYDSLGDPLPLLAYNDYPAAGLTTSVRDLARFAAASLTGRPVLRADTLKSMHAPVANTRWSDRDPLGPNPQYGLGYTVRPAQLDAHVGIGHGGSNNGWESLFQIIPDTRDGIVIMTNSSNGTAVISSVLCAWRQWKSAAGKATECPAVDARVPLYAAYKRAGAAAVVEQYRKLRAAPAAKYEFSVPQLNSMGYLLLRRGDAAGALTLFELNAATFPGDWNVHDSLGEILLKTGDKTRAIASYRKSVELNPHNDNGRNVLRELGEAAP